MSKRSSSTAQTGLQEKSGYSLMIFAPPPPKEDCPICCLPMPPGAENTTYKVCCGQVICCGCLVAAAHAENNAHCPRCPFCRNTASTSDSILVKQNRKRMEEHNDAIAAYGLAGMYLFGNMGLHKTSKKRSSSSHVHANLEVGSPQTELETLISLFSSTGGHKVLRK